MSEPVYRAYYKAKNREEYMEAKEADNIVSYNALDTETSTGESLMPDMEESSPEDKIIARDLSAELHHCISQLPKAERELITAIYFEGMTEKDYAEKVKLTVSGVCRRHKKILSKMRTFLNF